MFTTAEDLARWVINFEDKKIGGPDVIKHMQQQSVLNNGKQLDYAFGLSIRAQKQKRQELSGFHGPLINLQPGCLQAKSYRFAA